MKRTYRKARWWQGWTRFHLITVGIMAAFAFAAGLRALLVIGSGGWAAETSILLPYEAAAVWPMIHDNQSRVRWVAGVDDIVRLTRDADTVGSRRMLWMVRGEERWKAVEMTEKLVPERMFQTYLESDVDRRRIRVELQPKGPCATLVGYVEHAELLAYSDRYWAFLTGYDENRRAARSVEALAYWAEKKLPSCKIE